MNSGVTCYSIRDFSGPKEAGYPEPFTPDILDNWRCIIIMYATAPVRKWNSNSFEWTLTLCCKIDKRGPKENGGHEAKVWRRKAEGSRNATVDGKRCIYCQSQDQQRYHFNTGLRCRSVEQKDRRIPELDPECKLSIMTKQSRSRPSKLIGPEVSDCHLIKTLSRRQRASLLIETWSCEKQWIKSVRSEGSR